jgi:hypothetical protein
MRYATGKGKWFVMAHLHLLIGELLMVAVHMLLRLLCEMTGRVVRMPRHTALRLIIRINVRVPPSGILTRGLPPTRNSLGVS